MPLKIRISNLNRKRRINRKAIREAVIFVLRCQRISQALIDITFVNNARIKMLNKKYMHRNRPTDVLSFLLEEKNTPQKSKLIGDIYISSDVACDNARRFKTSLQKELLLYTIHGLLHLLGFGDKTVKERDRIRNLEQSFLRKVVVGKE